MIPQHIIRTINDLLAPYGESYHPGSHVPAKGYLTPAKAAEYLGVSRSSFYRAVERGDIPTKKINDGARNGLVLVAIEDLDRFAR